MIEEPFLENNEPEILSFEQFCFRGEDGRDIPFYNNFFLHFTDSELAILAYQKRDYFLRFKNENNDLNEELYLKILQCVGNNEMSRSDALKPCDHDLYNAYKIMKGYGVDDRRLFG